MTTPNIPQVSEDPDGTESDERPPERHHVGRVVFETILLVIAIWYAIEAFKLSRDNLQGHLGGAGLFPQILGVAMVIGAVIALIEDGRAAWADWRSPDRTHPRLGPGLRLALWQGALAVVFVLLFSRLTIWASATIYLVVSIATMERPVKPVQLVVCLVLTVGLIYILNHYLDAELP